MLQEAVRHCQRNSRTSERSPAHELVREAAALIGADGPTGGFFDDEGPVIW